jgi:hypothetical protein
MNTLHEEWRPVPEYEGTYEVSSLGRVRSLPRVTEHSVGYKHPYPGKIFRPSSTPDGYQRVSLSKNGRARGFTVHMLVALAFLGPRPPKHHTDHINRKRDDNRAVNLRYLHRSANLAQGDIRGTRNGQAKLAPEQVLAIVGMRDQPRAQVAARFGVSHGAIDDILRGRNWSHLTGIPRPPFTPRRRGTS